MVEYIRANCTKCSNVVLLTYEVTGDPASPVEEGDSFKGKCPICEEETTLRTIKRYT